MSQLHESGSWTSLISKRRLARSGARNRRRPCLETLESRKLLANLASDFAIGATQLIGIGIVAGPHGNLWAADFGGSQIVQVNPTSHSVVSSTPTPAKPNEITVGPDGDLWFTVPSSNSIVKLDPNSLLFTTYNISASYPAAEPIGITVGPGGNLWFTDFHSKAIGMITTSGVATEFTPATPLKAGPFQITAGPDGNLWFTELAGYIGMFNPSNGGHYAPEIQSGGAGPNGLAFGSDGNLWFTYTASGTGEIGMYNVKTQQPPTAFLTPAGGNSDPYGITAGPDGNLWFTEAISKKIGLINPVTHQTADFQSILTGGPVAVTPGPDGNVWFGETNGYMGLVTLDTHLVVTVQPPSNVSAGAPFGLTVADIYYDSGTLDKAFNGSVSVALASNLGGASLGGALTATATNGVATFAGLSLNKPGNGYILLARSGPTLAAETIPINVVALPTVINEQVLVVGKGKHKKIAGFELDFNTPLDPTRAQNSNNYTLTQLVRHRGRFISQSVHFQTVYNASAKSVRLLILGRTKFAAGGQLIVNAGSPSGITDTSGIYLDGNHTGAAGDNGVFFILPNAQGIHQ